MVKNEENQNLIIENNVFSLKDCKFKKWVCKF
jgi:hypothetical protein